MPVSYLATTWDQPDPDLNRFQSKEDFFRQLCTFIDTHCEEDLSLDQIASLAGFSKYHFTKLFHHYTGESYYHYLSRQRIALSTRLLTNPQYTITEVALNSGFTSMSAFLRMFHQLEHCTPTEYRRCHQKEPMKII